MVCTGGDGQRVLMSLPLKSPSETRSQCHVVRYSRRPHAPNFGVGCGCCPCHGWLQCVVGLAIDTAEEIVVALGGPRPRCGSFVGGSGRWRCGDSGQKGSATCRSSGEHGTARHRSIFGLVLWVRRPVAQDKYRALILESYTEAWKKRRRKSMASADSAQWTWSTLVQRLDRVASSTTSQGEAVALERCSTSMVVRSWVQWRPQVVCRDTPDNVRRGLFLEVRALRLSPRLHVA